MHRDPKQWAYIRRLIMEEGHSRKGVSRMTGLNRTTIRRMLKSPQPPQPRVPDSADQRLLKAAQILAGERNSIDPSVYRRRLLRLWGRARDLVLTLNRREAAALLDQVAELINGCSAATPLSVSASTLSPRPGSIRAKGIADRDWMDRLLLRLRHKLQKPSNDAAFERLKDWLFMLETPHVLGLRWICDAVVLGKYRRNSLAGVRMG
jgi:hypothetical protein